MSLKAYIRYDNKGRIVPGGPIVTSIKPKVGDWVAVEDVLVTTTPSNYKLRAFVRYINRIGGQKNGNKYVAGSLILQHNPPKDGKWQEIYALNPACCGAATYYNVAGCERQEYHVIKYTGVGTLPLGTIVNNSTPECFYIIDKTTGPEDVGTVQTVWNTLGNCNPCIDSHLEWYEVTECYTTNVINSVSYNTGTFQLNDGVTYYLGGDWTITNILYTDPGGAQYGLSNLFSTGCPTTTTTTTTTPPYRYYNVNGYSCNPCNLAGQFTVFVPYNTPLTIGYFYNNPENRGYSFEILEEIAPVVGGYDLTGEPGYTTCVDACTPPTTTTTTTVP